MTWILGIDIGGTNLVVGAVASDGSRVVGAHSRLTNAARGPDAIVDELVSMAHHTADLLQAEVPGAQLIGVGAGAPGPLDTREGVVLLTPNLGWINMPLRDRLENALGLPTFVDNDANCAVLGESWVGAARGARYVIGVTIGTGIGGGIVVDGRLYHGASDCAGEIGHMSVDLDGRRCACGNYGCLEAYASGPAIARRAVEEIEAGAPTTMADLVGGDLSAITAQTVYEAANLGDELAQDVVRSTAHYLGAGLASLINILNPDLLVLVGGVTLAGERLFAPLRYEITRRAFRPAVQACAIVPGDLDGLAGVFGAAKVFLNRSSEG